MFNISGDSGFRPWTVWPVKPLNELCRRLPLRSRLLGRDRTGLKVYATNERPVVPEVLLSRITRLTSPVGVRYAYRACFYAYCPH